MPIQVAVIVEGQGEYVAIRTVLQRVWYDLLSGDFIDVLRPLRIPQGTLSKEEGLKKAVDAAKIKLGPDTPEGARKRVLILMDSEGQCPRDLAPQLVLWGRQARADADIACTLPHPMFETWFAAAASSLAGWNGLPGDLAQPEDPEGRGLGKSWLKKLLRRKYVEPVDQPRFAARMSLALCRQNSPSFDKLCRELAKRLPPSAVPVGRTE